jgi:BTB/POZ domain
METLVFEVTDFADKHLLFEIKAVSRALGCEWKLLIFPNQHDGNVSLYIACISIPCPISFCYTIAIDSLRKEGSTCGTLHRGHELRGFEGFVARAKVLDPTSGLLDKSGTMHVTVRLGRVAENMIWSPKIDCNGTLGDRLLVDQKWTDISFSVGGKVFAAHKSVLAVGAPALLLEMKEPYLDEAIELFDITPSTFENLLSFCCTKRLATECSSFDEGRALLRAADRFECVSLKLFIESMLVNSFLKAINAAECLLLAKSHSCALLEEAAIGMVKLLPDEVCATTAWATVTQDGRLMTKILRATIDPPTPTIAELRKQLSSHGLDIDGSRETLVKRLKAPEDKTEVAT